MDELLPSTVPWKDIFDDALVNDLQSVKRHVEELHFPLNQTNLDKETVAHIAAKENNLVMLKYLLGKYPKLLELQDKWDQTVLTVAIDKGAIDIVRYLVDDLKADIYHPHNQRFGNQAVHIAAEEGQYEILKYFIEEKHVDANILNYLQEPAVFLAVETARFRCLKYLVEKAKANVTVLDSNNDNILYVAAMKGNMKATKYLLDERKIPFDINWRDRFGRTIVYVASRFDQLEFIKYCVEEKGADIHIANNRGWTPLFEAAWIGNINVMKYLLGKGADINHRDIVNQTIEQVANTPQAVEFLNQTRQHERSRRSVPMNLFRSYDSDTIVASETIQRLKTPEISVEGRPFADIVPSPFQGLLVVADTVVKYAKGSSLRRQRRHNEGILSPRKAIETRMDHVAVNAIGTPLDPCNY